MGALLGNKLILGVGGGVIAAALIGVVLFVFVLGGGSAPAEAVDAHGAEAAPKAAAKTTAASKTAASKKDGGAGEEHHFGPMYTVKDRVINLADPGGRRYLRVSVALEFDPIYAPADTGGGGHGGGSSDPIKAFNTKIAPKAPVIEDTVINVLSAKFYADIATPEGKDRTKKEILDGVNKALHNDEIINVYFTEFVIQ